MSTRWRPNTCGCELLFDQGPEQPPTHLKRCRDHPDATGLEVWDENRTLNRALGVIVQQTGIDPLAVAWRFEPDPARLMKRRLHLTLPPSASAVVHRGDLPAEVVVEVDKPPEES